MDGGTIKGQKQILPLPVKVLLLLVGLLVAGAIMAGDTFILTPDEYPDHVIVNYLEKSPSTPVFLSLTSPFGPKFIPTQISSIDLAARRSTVSNPSVKFW